MERIWYLSAAILMLAACGFFWFQNFDYTFVTAVLGSLAWLLGYREQTKNKRLEDTAHETENVEN